MKINRKTLIIKIHYFLFFGGMAPIMPFLLVLSLQLGVSVPLMGILGAAVSVATMLLKPPVSYLADALPRYRKGLFVATVLLTCLSFSSLGFVPPFTPSPHYQHSWLIRKDADLDHMGLRKVGPNNAIAENDTHKKILPPEGPSNDIQKYTRNDLILSDFYKFNQYFVHENISWDNILLLLPNNGSCLLTSAHDCRRGAGGGTLLQLSHSHAGGGYDAYGVQTNDLVTASDAAGDTPLWCVRGEWSGGREACGWSVVSSGPFWGFALLLLVASVAFSTANSFTDAITVETVGENDDYGSQRLWGSLGWGLLGPIGGLLIDFWSGPAHTKDYTPAFILVFVISGLDILASTHLKVPALRASGTVWAAVRPLIVQPRFVLFLLFATLNGALCGAVQMYLFVLQEEMASAVGGSAEQHIKFTQGLTVLVRSMTELPFMYFCDRVVRRIGAAHLTSLVLGLHVVRLLLVAAAGRWGALWTTVVAETFNGPCYGLGYPGVVLYAAHFSPAGASTTVQSLSNVCYDTLGFAIASIVSGLLIEWGGIVNMFLVWAAVGIITCLLHVVFVFCTAPLNDLKLKREPVAESCRDAQTSDSDE